MLRRIVLMVRALRATKSTSSACRSLHVGSCIRYLPLSILSKPLILQIEYRIELLKISFPLPL